MIPRNDPSQLLQNVYENKLRALLEKNSSEIVKISIRVLREEFGFTPVQISQFTNLMEERLTG